MTLAIIKDLIPFIIVLVSEDLVFTFIFYSFEGDAEHFINSHHEYTNLDGLTRGFFKTWDFMIGASNYKF